MKTFLVNVYMSKKGTIWLNSCCVMVEAKSFHSARLIAKKAAEKKNPGWKAKLDRYDGPVYENIKFIKA